MTPLDHKYVIDIDTTYALLAVKHDAAVAAGKGRLANAIYIEMCQYALMQAEVKGEATP